MSQKRYKAQTTGSTTIFIEDVNGDLTISDIDGYDIDLEPMNLDDEKIEIIKQSIESRDEVIIIKKYNELGLKPWLCCDCQMAVSKLKKVIRKYERKLL